MTAPPGRRTWYPARMPGAAALVAVLLALAGAALAAGTTGPDTEAVIRISAVVTDTKGRPLSGLGVADFDVLVDGKPNALDRVEVSAAGADAPPRTFAFLLDEFHVAAEDSAAVREALLKFVDGQMRPSDEALVVKPLDSIRELTPTSNRDAIRRAIASFEGRKGDYTPRTEFERNYMAQAPDAVAAARAQIVTSALRAIGVSAAQRGAAGFAIVLVSDGFARMRSSREVPANLQSAIRIANRADAPVYAFAPSLSAPATDDQQPDPGYTALATLTAHTGGALVTRTPSMDAGLVRMIRDLDSHYVLTYRAAHGKDGRFHQVRVDVKRPGVQVRARAGYLAPPSEEQVRTARAGATPMPMRVLRRSTLIQSWSGMTPTDPKRARIVISWEPADAKPGAPARGRAAAVMITASTPDGTILFDGVVAPVGSDGVNQARFEAPVGPIQVDMKILDEKGVVIDTDARDIAIPAPKAAGPTIYPPAVLRTRNAREFREISADPYAPPSPAREFRRTERLILRVPAITASGDEAEVRAVLLNRQRQPMRDLVRIEGISLPATTQFDLPLAPLVPGDYSVRVSVDGPNGGVSEYVSFKVGG